MSQRVDSERPTISVHNIGGIDSCNITFDPGVTVLTGQNATNRTSLLTAIASALGGSAGSLKGDADEGEVTLKLGEEEYTRRFIRMNGETVVEGEPYTENEILVDYFVCLTESNPARQAVERGDDLREIIMRPVDTEAIQDRIDTLQKERSQLQDQLSTIDRRRDRLPELEERRADLGNQRMELAERLEDLRQEIESYDADRDEADAAEAAVQDHQEVQAEREEAERELETQRASLNALREDYQEVQAELEELPTNAGDELSALEAELEQLHERKQSLSDTINRLSTIVEFNDELLETDDDPIAVVSTDDTQEEVTSQLDPMSESIECWTCGSQVQRQAIADRLEELRAVINAQRTERQEIQERIDDIADQRDELATVAHRREELSQQLDHIETEKERRNQRINDLEDQITELNETLEDLEQQIENTEELRDSELLEKYQTVSELEYERGQIEQELEEVKAEIEKIEEVVADRGWIEEELSEVQDELTSLRNRIETVEQEAVDIFNDQMEELIGLLAYQNIERVWIERKTLESNIQVGGPESTFDLHIVRTTTEGTVYEDTIEHLSESEREIIGLMVALAGYITHDVHEVAPMLLLDSVEAIDAERISRLVSYLADFAPYLVVALLPEDAASLPDDYTQIPADAIST